MRRVTGDRPVPGPVSRVSDRLLLFEHHPPGRGDGRHLDSQRVRLVGGKLSPQLTAFLTSAPILASSAAVNSVSAKATGHMAPSSRFLVRESLGRLADRSGALGGLLRGLRSRFPLSHSCCPPACGAEP